MKKALLVTYLADFNCDAGDKIYSVNVINEISKIFDLDVLSYSNSSESSGFLGGIKSSWKSIFSFYPSSIFIYKSKNAIEKLLEFVRESQYDCIIFDHFRTAWMVDYLNITENINTIYISHNIEHLSRSEGFLIEPNYLKKIALFYDYMKVRFWESRILRKFSCCSAISDYDKKQLDNMGIVSELMKPGYSGDKIINKDFESIDNLIAWVGSFKYFAKRINLLDFCESVLQKKKSGKMINFRILVVGLMDERFYKEITERYSFCEVKANVHSVFPYLKLAKCGIIYEPVGGGFKLKSLDYVFSRTPVLALTGSCEGLGLINGVHFIEKSSVDGLVDKIIELMDDNLKLKMLSDNAYDLCDNQFDWEKQVRSFFHAFI